MKILYVTQWFEPEPVFKGLDFAKSLKARGHDVDVATGFPNYPGGTLYPGYSSHPYRKEIMDGIAVHRLYLYPSHDRSPMSRSLNYLSFFLSVLVFGIFAGRKYDAVYVYHPPITAGLAVSLFSRIHRLFFVIDIQDLWPDSVAASGMLGARAVSVIDRLCRHVYSAADHIVVQSEGMRSKMIERGVDNHKLTRIYNWSSYKPAALGEPVADRLDFVGHINVVYGGNLGQAQALGSLIDAFDIARRQVPTLRLHLFGDGLERSSLQDRARDCADGDLIVHPPVSRSEMDRILDAADILAVHLKDDPLYGITIPSKTQHYLACGRPILAGLCGEAADILRQSGGAVVCRPADVMGLAAGLLELANMTAEERCVMGGRGRQYYSENFGMGSAIDRTDGLLRKQR